MNNFSCDKLGKKKKKLEGEKKKKKKGPQFEYEISPSLFQNLLYY